MNNLEIRPDNRSPASYIVTTTIGTNRVGQRIAGFRSPRKLGKALVSGELVLLAGDTIIAGKVRVVS